MKEIELFCHLPVVSFLLQPFCSNFLFGVEFQIKLLDEVTQPIVDFQQTVRIQSCTRKIVKIVKNKFYTFKLSEF